MRWFKGLIGDGDVVNLGEAEKPAGVEDGTYTPGDQQINTVFLQPAAAVAIRHIFRDIQKGAENLHLTAVRVTEEPQVKPAECSGRVRGQLRV